MSSTDIIALVITIIGVASFATVVTILFRNYVRSTIKEIKAGHRDIEIVDLMIYELDPKVIKQRKAGNLAKNIVYYAFLAVVIPLFGLSLYSRIKNNVTKFGDNFVMVVASGSMSMKNEVNDYLVTYNLNNQFQTYDMIVLTGVKSSVQLQLYDVIAYRNDKGVNVIHRIIGIEYFEGEVRYVTRGDSNSASDSYHPQLKDIIGKYTGKRINGVGIFIMFFQSYAGIVTILSVVYCSFMISHFNKKLDIASDERRDLLATLFDVKEMTEKDPNLMTDVHASTIYYKGYAYEISSDGTADKREMTQEEMELYNVVEEPIKIEEKQEENKELEEDSNESKESKESESNENQEKDINEKVDEQGE